MRSRCSRPAPCGPQRRNAADLPDCARRSPTSRASNGPGARRRYRLRMTGEPEVLPGHDPEMFFEHARRRIAFRKPNHPAAFRSPPRPFDFGCALHREKRRGPRPAEFRAAARIPSSSRSRASALSPLNSVARNSPVDKSTRASPITRLRVAGLAASARRGMAAAAAALRATAAQIIIFFRARPATRPWLFPASARESLAAAQAFSRPRRFHLLADGDLVSCANQPRDVVFGRMVGNTAHRDGIAFFFIARSERDLQNARRQHRVFVEKFVEISQTK